MSEKKVQRRTIVSREKLLDASWKLFCEKGYFNTNTKEIAKSAGISVGNFYNYYQDKMSIYLELTKRYLDGNTRAIENLRELMPPDSDKRLEIKKYIMMQMDRANHTGRFFSDCHVLAQDSEELQNLFRVANDEILEAIESLLRGMTGMIQRASYPVMARFMFTMIDLISQDIMTTKDTDIYEEYTNQLITMSQVYLFGEKN